MDSIVNDFKLDTTIHEDCTAHHVDHKHEKWYRERKLGEGGFGVVWLEREEATNNYRAVKIVPSFGGLDIRRELLALEKFSRPRFRQHFVRFYGWYDHIGHGVSSIFLTMEYFSRGDLRSFMKKKGALGESEAMTVAKGLAGGLRMLHEEGFVHRDLKLDNIFVVSDSPSLIVKIGDFGLAKHRNEHTAFRTSVGTLVYDAPEQIDDQRSTDEYTNAVDMWCLGHVVFELLTAKTVFSDRNELKKYCEHRKDFPRHYLEAIPVSSFGIEVTECLMARRPSERLSASECWSRLQQYVPSAPSVSASSRPPQYVSIATSASASNWAPQYVSIAASASAPNRLQQDLTSTASNFTSTQEDSKKESERKGAMLLLEYNGYDIFSKYVSKRRALLWAASEGHEAAVRLLLEKGAEINSKNVNGETALHMAVVKCHCGIVRLLLEYRADVWAMDNFKSGTALHYAVKPGGEAMIRLLLENTPAVIKALDRDQMTALHLGVKRGHEDLVRLLLEKGAAYIEDKYQKTALHCAVSSKKQAMVQLLVEKMADTSDIDKNGETPLLNVAVKWENDALVKLLVEKGADIEAINKDGDTVLLVAVRLNHISMVSLLLGYGANPNAAGQYRRTALCEAVGQVFWASRYHDPAHEGIVKLLLENGANPNGITQIGSTALYEAALHGNKSLVRLLLDNGANIEAIDKDGETALQRAARSDYRDAVKLLLENGADKTKLSLSQRLFRGPSELEVAVATRGSADGVNESVDEHSKMNTSRTLPRNTSKRVSSGMESDVKRWRTGNADVDANGGEHADAAAAVENETKATS